jgi:poly(hydroxyalkanoate) depolymerase family esterase
VTDRAREGALLLAGALLAAAVPGPSRAEEGRFTRGTLGGRAYGLYVPAGDARTARPLVVALHGCWQTPEDFARGTRLNAAAERRGLLVLYPAQGRADNPSRCWNWFEAGHRRRSGGGEVAEVLALIAEVGRAHPVAADRTIALGLSAGGFMAVNLACAAPDVIRGIGVVAGGPYRCGEGATGAFQCLRGEGLDPARSAAACLAAAGRGRLPVRASLWQGADDVVVVAANLTALETMFARVTDALTSLTEPTRGAVRSRYRDAEGRVRVEAWLVPRLGHTWPGGDPRGTHAVPWGPPATELILDFLLE